MVLIGATGFAASLVAVYEGMRYVMVNNGGYCASGGPYQIAAGHECDGSSVAILMGGVVIGLVFAALLAVGSSQLAGLSVAGVGLLMWTALFGALGWNFIELGADPPAQMTDTSGWIISGVVFMLMALGGLIPAVYLLAQSLKDPDSSEFKERYNTEPLVRAKIPGRGEQ